MTLSPRLAQIGKECVACGSCLRVCPRGKISLGIRWASRQADGLYLQSQYGTLQIGRASCRERVSSPV